MKIIEGDEAFYSLHKEEKLKGVYGFNQLVSDEITLNRTVAIIATHNQRDARRVMMISLKCLNDLEVIIQRSMRLNCIKRYM